MPKQKEQGYTPFTDTVTGELKFIENATGEVYDSDSHGNPVGSLYFTPEEQRLYKERRELQRQSAEKAFYRAAKIAHENPLGNFILSEFERGKPITEVSAENFARLVYLATYIHYDSRTVYKQRAKPLVLSELPAFLNVSRSTARRFLNDTVSNDLVEISDDKTISVNGSLFSKGRKGYTGYTNGFMKLYSNQIRRLYLSVPATSHCYLGYVFQMMPYINIKYNILCYNPLEEDISNIQPMNMAEFCEHIGKARQSARDIQKKYSDLGFEMDGEFHKFCSIVTTDTGKEIIFINPRIMFMGEDWRYVEQSLIYFTDPLAAAKSDEI